MGAGEAREQKAWSRDGHSFQRTASTCPLGSNTACREGYMHADSHMNTLTDNVAVKKSHALTFSQICFRLVAFGRACR